MLDYRSRHHQKRRIAPISALAHPLAECLKMPEIRPRNPATLRDPVGAVTAISEMSA